LPLARALRGEQVRAVEMRFRDARGRERYTSVSAAPFRDQQGKIEGAVTVSHDLTERKRREEQEHFLAEVSKVLASSLDYQTTLTNIAPLVVPQLADWFTVDLVDANGNF